MDKCFSNSITNPTQTGPQIIISLQNQRLLPSTQDHHSLRNTNSSIAAIPPNFWSTALEGSSSTPMAITACCRGEIRPTLMKDMLMFSPPNTDPTFPIMPGWSTCRQSMMLPSRLTSTLKLPTFERWGTPSFTFPSSVISEVWSGIALANLDSTWNSFTWDSKTKNETKKAMPFINIQSRSVMTIWKKHKKPQTPHDSNKKPHTGKWANCMNFFDNTHILLLYHLPGLYQVELQLHHQMAVAPH